MIVVEDLHKSFGEVTAVQGVSFSAEDGRITGLLGPNGAGKSTTLRILTTVIAADSGRASVDGHRCAVDALDVRRAMGVMPHDSGVYPRLTARENIAYFAELNGLVGAERDRRVQAVIDDLEIQEFADRRTEGFSQGQRTKVALARALVHDPKNVILDEPTNGLDVMATRALREYIRTMKAQGRCVLFSSHVMQEVAALCDHIVIISHGRVSAQGTPDQIKEQTGESELEDAFVKAIGDAEGLE